MMYVCWELKFNNLKKKSNHIIFIIFLLVSQVTLAQNLVLDSLNNELIKHENNDSLYFITLFSYVEQQLEYTEDNPIPLLEKAQQRAVNIQSQKKSDLYLAQIFSLKGYYYDLYGNYPEAIKLYYQSLELAEKYNEQKLISASFANLAYVFELQGDFQKSIEYYQKSLEIKRKLGDLKALANTINNLA